MADKIIRLTEEQADELCTQFGDWVRETFGPCPNRSLRIGGKLYSWSADYSEGRGRNYRYYGAAKYGLRFKVDPVVNAQGKSAVENKLHYDLASAQRRMSKHVESTRKNMERFEVDLFNSAQKFFDIGWCAYRMRRRMTSDENGGGWKVKGIITDSKGAREGWIDAPSYSEKLDTIVVPSISCNGSILRIPLEQNDAIMSSVTVA